jgi:hypothetical protein
MSTSTTLRLAGLAAAIAVSLSITSSALAKPVGNTTAAKDTGSITIGASLPSDSGMSAPAGGITVTLHRSGVVVGGPLPSDSGMGAPSAAATRSAIVVGGPADNSAEIGTPVLSSPVARADNPAEIGTPASVPLTAPPVEVTAQGFSWQDATIGALVGMALACLAAFGVGSMRGRRLALRA